jgi:hypothetical protein
MREKGIRSLRELARVPDTDVRIRRLCLIADGEKGYTRSGLSRFTKRIGADVLQLIIEEKAAMLLRRAHVSEVDVVLDAAFVKAWSVRDPEDNRAGLSDLDAMVGRNGRGYGLGYKLHSSVEPERILPLACLVAPANENEKRHAPALVGRAREVLGRVEAGIRCLIGDSQISSRRVRELAERTVIPYASNQVGDGLRVDRWFRVHGPPGLVEVYRKRPKVEAFFAFLRTQFGLGVNRVRGLAGVTLYALLSVLCIVLNREAAENMGRPDKALSPTFFNT